MAGQSRCGLLTERNCSIATKDQMLVMSLTADGTVKMRPRVLFEGSFVGTGPSGHPGYDVSPGGKGFVMLVTDPTYELLPSELHVILDWRAAIRP